MHRNLDLLYVRFGGEEPAEEFRSIPGIQLHALTPSRGARRALTYTGARLHGVPDGFARGVSPELAEEATRLSGLRQRGRVIADGPTAAAALWGLMGHRPVIYNAYNIESSFRHELQSSRVAKVGDRHTLRFFERRLLARAHEAWMVSEDDMGRARELCPRARLRYAPNVVDVEAITPITDFSDLHRAIFVASFNYQPNRNGLKFLLEEVFPRVWAELPDARLALVGAGLKEPPSSDPRVESLGFVDDLAATYATARCAVVPLLQGGGTPLKLIEALAHGLPTVATTRAAAGLQLRDGEQCQLADGGEAFAKALIATLRDGAPELGRRGRAFVRERYSIEALGSLLAPKAG